MKTNRILYVLFVFVLSLAVQACGSAPSAPTVPTSTPGPVVIEANSMEELATKVETMMPISTPEPQSAFGCVPNDLFQQKLEEAIRSDSVLFSEWKGRENLKVNGQIDTSTNQWKQFNCLHMLTMWSKESVWGKNTERYTQQDLIFVLAAAKAIDPEAYLALFVWDNGVSVQAGDISSFDPEKLYGGLYLYTDALWNDTPVP